jgi:hypothetical protein
MEGQRNGKNGQVIIFKFLGPPSPWSLSCFKFWIFPYWPTGNLPVSTDPERLDTAKHPIMLLMLDFATWLVPLVSGSFKLVLEKIEYSEAPETGAPQSQL